MGIMPASVNPITGIISINQRIWDKIPPATRLFVLLHEYSHIALQTDDEATADAHGMKLYEQLGYSEKQAIETLKKLLPFTSKEHFLRVSQLTNLALADDGKIT